jgi:hypothetical protein
VDDARCSSWRRYFATFLYLFAKPTHVGVDMDGLAYPLHHPMICDRQTRGHGLLPGSILFHRYTGAVAPFWGM